MTHRIEKVESTLGRAIQQVISQGLHDPRAGGLISVLRVDISADMVNATVFISIYPEEKSVMTMHALRHAAKHIRHQVGDMVAIRRVPVLDFKLDRSLKQQAEAYTALAKAREQTRLADEAATDEGKNPGEPDAPAPAEANDPPAPPQPPSPWARRPGKEP